ncbi:alanine dehydrogenase, partial [Arthrobacter sp. UYEF3]
VPNTSTYALTNVTLRYAVSLANLGVQAAFERDAALAAGLNIAAGQVAHHSVSEAHKLPLVADWHQLVSA